MVPNDFAGISLSKGRLIWFKKLEGDNLSEIKAFGPTQNGRLHFTKQQVFLVHFFEGSILSKNVSGSKKLAAVLKKTSWPISNI